MSKLRSSAAVIAPHRAVMQWSPQGGIASPRRCVGTWMSSLPRASKMSDNNNARLRIIRIIGDMKWREARLSHVLLFEKGQYSGWWLGYSGWYYRTSSMPVAMGLPITHTPSRHAIPPFGLHCVAARCGAITAALLRSLLSAIREVMSHRCAAYWLPSGKGMSHRCCAACRLSSGKECRIAAQLAGCHPDFLIWMHDFWPVAKEFLNLVCILSIKNGVLCEKNATFAPLHVWI